MSALYQGKCNWLKTTKKNFSNFSDSLENTYYFEGVRHPLCLALECHPYDITRGRGGWQARQVPGPGNPSLGSGAGPTRPMQSKPWGLSLSLSSNRDSGFESQTQRSQLQPWPQPSQAQWAMAPPTRCMGPVTLPESQLPPCRTQWTEHTHVSHLPPNVPMQGQQGNTPESHMHRDLEGGQQQVADPQCLEVGKWVEW